LNIRVNHSNDRFRIAIMDNGVGISRENLAQVCNLGFTTKKDGHGFGLHSALAAAQEMGGSLTVQSDGPGRGATFTLELPANLASSPAAAPQSTDRP
jgi:signal transduction histidine kinase